VYGLNYRENVNYYSQSDKAVAYRTWLPLALRTVTARRSFDMSMITYNYTQQ